MKKYLLVLTAIFAVSELFALGFSTVIKGKSGKFSTCEWESDPHNNPVPMKGKPGRKDYVWLKTGSKDFVIDMPVECKGLSVMYDTHAVMDGKKLTTKEIYFSHGGWTKSVNFLKLRKCQVALNGSMQFSVWEKCKEMGSSTLYLEDTKMDMTGNIMFTMPAIYVKPVKNHSGATIDLTGNSQINAKGELVLDSIMAEMPDLHFRLVFNEKDGKMPSISIKNANVSNAELKVNVKGKLKKGVYPLLASTGKKAPTGKFRSITFNGKNVSLGSTTAQGGLDYTIKLGSLDGKSQKDYILEVK